MASQVAGTNFGYFHFGPGIQLADNRKTSRLEIMGQPVVSPMLGDSGLHSRQE